jgi:plastocyanin
MTYTHVISGRLLALAAAGTLALAACAGGSAPAGSAASAPAGAASVPAAAGVGCAPSPTSKPTGGGQVAIVDFAFNPTTVSVAKGGTVTWSNTGTTAHTVTADDASCDSGNVDPGTSTSFTFTAAGTFAYHCKIHPTMKATVTVSG